MVYRPVFRSSSATSSNATSQANQEADHELENRRSRFSAMMPPSMPGDDAQGYHRRWPFPFCCCPVNRHAAV